MITRDGDHFVATNPTPDELSRLSVLVKDGDRWLSPEAAMQVRYDEKTHTFWLPRTNEVLERALDAEHPRVGALRWAAPAEGATIKKMIEVSKVVASGLLDLDDPLIALRRKSCYGDPSTDQARCTALVTQGKTDYCNACGCGKTILSDYNGAVGKLRWRALRCPRFMPGFANAVGG